MAWSRRYTNNRKYLSTFRYEAKRKHIKFNFKCVDMKSVRKSVRKMQKKNRAKYENSALFLWQVCPI